MASSISSNDLNGPGSLAHTLLKSGVDKCFANPGTSEMHFVGALDRSRVILSSEAAGSRFAARQWST
jgi:thiamine pyrophosphate-dependent acetolactate synthase large subunit-like protein